ncbi:PREDICTED: serine protease persephone-like [Nicrophorus vespilloides]|uniref:Serine protease persephone-like n=1 Tax=Nicrophorus vespilloides TaxID=110193 RepID=A0ABM1M286_NICVS|nr:PREDICTED: serine protease persephone-like [Nicrophorus vespilloides]
MIIAKDVTALPFLLLLFAISIHATAIYFEEDINDCCDGETCMEIGFCPSAIEIVNKRQKPKPCGFIGKVPFVCCPDKVANNPVYVVLNIANAAAESRINSSASSTTTSTTTSTTASTTTTTTSGPIEIATTLSNDLTVVETTFANTETTPILNLPPSTTIKSTEYVVGSKVKQQCDKTYDKFTFDEYGKVIYTTSRDKPTLIENSPHAAALGNQKGDNIEWLCAGSLISEKFVLTAAHCIENNTINYVRVGDSNLTSNTDKLDPQNFTVVNAIMHPNYTKPLRYHDIGVLELDRPIIVNKFAKPACLHFNERISETNLKLVGFNDNSATNFLYTLTVAEADKRVCNFHFNLPMYKELLPDGQDLKTQICASGFLKFSPCQRDTGGPMQVHNWAYTEGRLLIGVTSIEKLCNGKNAPGLYTRISYYIPWIESVVWPDL